MGAMRLVFVLAFWIALLPLAQAVNPDERLNDPVLEQRAREISKELRCLQCQNQSIDDSDAGYSKDMRLLVRERLVAGDSDQQVIDYVVARYGEFALLRPQFSARNLALWLGPAVLFLVAATVIFLRTRRRPGASGAVDRLSAEEAKRLEAILAERAEKQDPDDR